MQMILETLRDKSPDQFQFEFAYWSLKIVRQWTLNQFPVKLSLSTVRRVLRRLGLTPQRPQFRAYRQNAAAVRTWIEETYPALAQRAPEQGTLLLLADEAGRTSHSPGALRGVPGARRLSSSKRGSGSGCTGCPRSAPREQFIPGSIPEPPPQTRWKSSCSRFRARWRLDRST